MLLNTKTILVDFRMFFLFSSIFSRIEVENVSWLSCQFPTSLVVIQHLLTSAKISVNVLSRPNGKLYIRRFPNKL